MDKIKGFKEYVLKYQLGYTLDNVSFKNMTSLHVGGICKLLYIPDDLESLYLCTKYLIKMNIKYFIIGSGTNILVNDRFFDMVLISLKNLNRCYIESEDDQHYYIYSESGVKGVILSKYLTDRLITGAEFLYVIPGTIGGMTYMNAGAYKKCMADIIDSITYIDNYGNIITKKNNNNNFLFDYRKSIFKNSNFIIISILIKLKKENIDIVESKRLIKSYVEKKKLTQPIGEKNAGSTFKNIENGYTWELVDNIGFRGYSIGDALVSNKHANFIINNGNATFDEITSLIKIIKDKVKDKFNIDLECEWEIID